MTATAQPAVRTVRHGLLVCVIVSLSFFFSYLARSHDGCPLFRALQRQRIHPSLGISILALRSRDSIPSRASVALLIRFTFCTLALPCSAIYIKVTQERSTRQWYYCWALSYETGTRTPSRLAKRNGDMHQAPFRDFASVVMHQRAFVFKPFF